MLSGTSEVSKDIVLDVSSDSVNNVFKPFGQRDSKFYFCYISFSAVLLLSERTLYIDIFSANGLDFMFVKRYNDEVEVCHKPE